MRGGTFTAAGRWPIEGNRAAAGLGVYVRRWSMHLTGVGAPQSRELVEHVAEGRGGEQQAGGAAVLVGEAQLDVLGTVGVRAGAALELLREHVESLGHARTVTQRRDAERGRA